eukprot:scaffold1367_cov56-Cyclotella_meneghiniana.AAC.5
MNTHHSVIYFLLGPSTLSPGNEPGGSSGCGTILIDMNITSNNLLTNTPSTTQHQHSLLPPSFAAHCRCDL